MHQKEGPSFFDFKQKKGAHGPLCPERNERELVGAFVGVGFLILVCLVRFGACLLGEAPEVALPLRPTATPSFGERIVCVHFPLIAISSSAMTVRYIVIPRRPYSLARTAARLARFPERVDRFEDGTFRRLLFVKRKPLLLQVRQEGSPSRATLRLTLDGDGARSQEARTAAAEVLERVLGTSTDVRPFYLRFRHDSVLGPMIREDFGLRVVGRLRLWDTLIQIVLSQQINLTLAHDILCELVQRYGRSARIDGGRYFAFPTTRRFAALSETELRGFRLSRAKASTLIGLARAFEAGEISDGVIGAMDDDEAVESLMSFKGVGRWTAEFALLRGGMRMDIFPGGDLGVVKYLARQMLGHEGAAKEEEMRLFAERWRP